MPPRVLRPNHESACFPEREKGFEPSTSTLARRFRAFRSVAPRHNRLKYLSNPNRGVSRAFHALRLGGEGEGGGGGIPTLRAAFVKPSTGTRTCESTPRRHSRKCVRRDSPLVDVSRLELGNGWATDGSEVGRPTDEVSSSSSRPDMKTSPLAGRGGAPERPAAWRRPSAERRPWLVPLTAGTPPSETRDAGMRHDARPRDREWAIRRPAELRRARGEGAPAGHAARAPAPGRRRPASPVPLAATRGGRFGRAGGSPGGSLRNFPSSICLGANSRERSNSVFISPHRPVAERGIDCRRQWGRG